MEFPLEEPIILELYFKNLEFIVLLILLKFLKILVVRMLLVYGLLKEEPLSLDLLLGYN